MRKAAVALAGALGLVLSAVSANAAPLVPSPAGQELAVIQVADGCGRGFQLNRWGRCVPSRYRQAQPRTQYRYVQPRTQYRYVQPRAHYRYVQPRTSWYGYPQRWHSPTDYMARQLNSHELGRIHSGGGVYYGRPTWGY